jgi:hypothetical protein
MKAIMGFWEVTKRVLQGKPGFEAPKKDADWDDDQPTIDFAEKDTVQEKTLYDEKGYKVLPIVAVTNVSSRQDSDHIELWATIKNESTRDIKLDKITLLGTTFRMNYPLSRGSQRVFRVYSGPQIKHDAYKTAELFYLDTATNDYLRADHTVEYRLESDGTFDINDFELITPIRDL